MRPRFIKPKFAPYGLKSSVRIVKRAAAEAYQSVEPQVGLPLWVRYNIVSRYWEYSIDNVTFFRLKENPYVPFEVYFKNIGTTAPIPYPAEGEARLYVRSFSGQPKAVFQWSDGSESIVATGPLALTWPTGTTSFWKMEEAAGLTRVDSVAAVNNLSDTGTVGQTAGKIGNCATFTIAGGQFLARASTATLDLGTGISCEFTGWFYFNGSATVYTIMSKGNNAAAKEYRLFYDGAGTFNWQVSTDGSAFQTVSFSLTPTINTWYHLNVYYDATAGQSGISINRSTFNTAVIAGVGIFAGGSQFRFGNFAGTPQFDGRLDAWGYWRNKILNTVERDLTWNSGLGAEYV